jgi:hypothetical protein
MVLPIGLHVGMVGVEA